MKATVTSEAAKAAPLKVADASWTEERVAVPSLPRCPLAVFAAASHVDGGGDGSLPAGWRDSSGG
jgi:hypothetical protein